MSKSILILMGEIPYPVFKGNQNRMFEFLKIFIDLNYDVHLNILNSNQKHRKSIDIEKDIKFVLPKIKTIQVRRHPKFKTNTEYNFRKYFENILDKNNDISNIETVPPNFKKVVSDSIKLITPDIIFVNYLKLSKAIPSSYKGRRICDLHDIQCDITKEAIRLNMLKKTIDIKKFCESELKLMKEYHTLIAINPNESKQIAKNINDSRNIITIPAFMELPKLEEDVIFDYDILFVGSGSPFNIDAAMKFIAKCMPILRKQFKNIKLAIVGDVSNTSAVKKVKNKDIFKLGRVDNLSKIYRKSKVVICPLRGGAGMKIKVIEALSHGKAIVTTNVGANGIQIINSINGFIEDDWVSFADKVALILKDDSIRLKIEKNARLTAVRYYQPSSIYSQLKKVIEGYDEYYSNFETDFLDIKENKNNNLIVKEKKKKMLIFSMEARLLMNYSIDFAEKIYQEGVEPLFIKVENNYFNSFQKKGFDVISIKDNFKNDNKEIDKIIKHYTVDIKNLKNIIYSDIDFSEDISIHKMMFPEHFKNDTKQIASVRYAFKLLITVDRIIAKYEPDCILGWNGNGPHMIYIFKVLAKKYNIPMIQMERGLLPNTYIVDTQGVNYKSNFSGSYLPLISKNEATNVNQYIINFQTNMQSIVGVSEENRTKEYIYTKLGLNLNENYIFFPQQIEGDSNIIINSNIYKKMHDVLSDLLIVAERLNLKVVTREHPENTKINKTPTHKLLILSNDIHIHSLLKFSLCNIVINSTVGLESLLFEKPTIALGNSLYSGKGFTYDVRSLEGIFKTIKENITVSQKFTENEKMKFNKFISFLIHDYLIFTDRKIKNKSILNILKATGLRNFSTLKMNNTLISTNNIFDSLIMKNNKNIMLIDTLGNDSRRYYTGSNRPIVDINSFFKELDLFCKNNYITLVSSEKNNNILENVNDFIHIKVKYSTKIKSKFFEILKNINNKNKILKIKNHNHKILEILKIIKEKDNKYDYIIIIIHQSEKEWLNLIKNYKTNSTKIFIDEYFTMY